MLFANASVSKPPFSQSSFTVCERVWMFVTYEFLNSKGLPFEIRPFSAASILRSGTGRELYLVVSLLI